MTTADAATDLGPRPSIFSRLRLDKYSAVYLWGVFLVFFGLTKPVYRTSASLSLTFGEKTVICVLALAFLVPLVTDTFDLSIGTNLTLSMVMLFEFNEHGWPLWLGMIASIAACAVAGFISGFIVVKLKVNSFIATLGMSQVIKATCLLISQNQQYAKRLPESFLKVGKGLGPLNLPYYFFYMLVLAAIIWYVFEHTPLGRYMFATGGGREAARLSGVKVDKLTWGSLVASAMIAGFAGFIVTWKTNTYNNNVGDGFLFPAVAAVFFGASQLKSRPNVWGTLIAVFALAFGIKGLQLSFDAGTFWIEPLFNGLSLLIAVSLASRQGIIKIRKRKAAAAVAAT